MKNLNLSVRNISLRKCCGLEKKNIKEEALKAGYQRQTKRIKERKGEDPLIQNEEKYFNS